MDRIDGMKAFVAVVETGSFSAAAKRLGLSNKLVSKYIATLEKQVGRTLLFRTTRAMSISPDGKVYLEGCRRVLHQLDALEASLDASEDLRGLLRVSAPVTFGEVMVTDAALSFMQKHPEIEVDVTLSDTHEDLAEKGFDLAIRIGTLKDSNLRVRKLGDTDLAVVATPFFLEQVGLPTHPSDLSTHECIRDINSETPNRWPFREQNKPLTVPVHGRFSCNSASACLAGARKGFGFAMVPNLFAQDDLATGRLVQVLPEFSINPILVQAVFLESGFERPKLIAFIDHIKEAIEAGKARCALANTP
ncbi:MAG: LysR family transcriptional regulator [Pseudomonadota bacterium]